MKLATSRISGTLAAVLVLATVAWTSVGGMARADGLSPSEARTFSAALKEVERGSKVRLDHYARKLRNPLARKIVSWYVLFQGGFGTDFKAIDTFIAKNPDWPRKTRLMARAEESMPADADPAFIIDWFNGRTPLTTLGAEKLGKALIAAGRKEEGVAVIRKAWIEGDLTKGHENAFYRSYRQYLTLEDNRKRADRLAWDGDYWPARRMLYRVDTDYRKLIEARTSLRRRRGDVDRLVAAVPKKYQNDPGLIFERVRWRRIADLDTAYDLLKSVPASAPRPDIWWNERAIQARGLLQKGFVSEAYRIAAAHGLTPDHPADHAEAEWFAGWVALRFLEDPKAAAGHFKRMYDAVSYPVSLARGAYWMGRAQEKAGIKDKASEWFATAARHPTTYYGQLAAGHMAPGAVLKLPPDASVADEIRLRFDGNELVRAVRMLAQAGEEERLFSFTMQIAALDNSPDWQVLTARLAWLSGRTDLAIRVAKNSLQDHGHYVAGGYPTLVLPPVPRSAKGKIPEQPLVLAVVRQESEYDPKSVSHAGARGLMQLMPATARQVAKESGLAYSKHKLVLDPDYNVTLGQSYLASLLDDFDGYLPMAIAAYNAGPHRVRRWTNEYGDPRDADVDPIDWIEMIPFSETRNYVQRVMENVQIYRLRLADTEVALRIVEDLRNN